MRWLLFIDESGAFTKPGDHCCVVGLLVREGARAADPQRLRQEFQGKLPWVRYPLHATDLNTRSCHLHLYVTAAVARPDLRAPELDDVVAALRATGDAQHQTFLGRADAGGKFRQDEASKAVDTWLPSTGLPGVGTLTAAVERCGIVMREVFMNLVTRLGTENVTVVAAVDRGIAGEVDEAAVDAATRVSRAAARYKGLLTALFERALALVHEPPDRRHEIEPWIARPRFKEGPAPDEVWRLDHASVAECVDRALHFPIGQPPGSRYPWIRFVRQPLYFYDDRVDPGIVLADFLSNRMRHALGKRPRSWAELSTLLETTIALSIDAPVRCRVDSAPMPVIAAGGGPAREAVVLAFECRRDRTPFTAPRTKLVDARPRWVREQAERWVELAEGLP